MPIPVDFPAYGDCEAKDKLDDLVRLLAPDLFQTDYIDARAGAKLVATALGAYRETLADPTWGSDPVLSRLAATGIRFPLVCAAVFDLVCNAEYLHGRITNDKWIYCNRHRGTATPGPVNLSQNLLLLRT